MTAADRLSPGGDELAPTHERLVEMIAAVIVGRASLKETLGIIEAMP